MQTTREFLDAVRERHSLTSDYQLAKFFGVNQTSISNYRVGRSKMDEEMCMRVADALSIEAAYVLARVAAERTHNERAKREWTALAKKLSPAVAVTLLLVAFGSALLSGEASALPYSLHQVCILCKIKTSPVEGFCTRANALMSPAL